VICDTTASVCSEPAGHSCHVHSMTCTPAVVFMPWTRAHNTDDSSCCTATSMTYMWSSSGSLLFVALSTLHVSTSCGPYLAQYFLWRSACYMYHQSCLNTSVLHGIGTNSSTCCCFPSHCLLTPLMSPKDKQCKSMEIDCTHYPQVVDETDRMLRQSYQDWLPYLTSALAAQKRAGHERVVKVVVSATLTRDPSKVERLGLHCPRYIAMTAQDHRCASCVRQHPAVALLVP